MSNSACSSLMPVYLRSDGVSSCTSFLFESVHVVFLDTDSFSFDGACGMLHVVRCRVIALAAFQLKALKNVVYLGGMQVLGHLKCSST